MWGFIPRAVRNIRLNRRGFRGAFSCVALNAASGTDASRCVMIRGTILAARVARQAPPRHAPRDVRLSRAVPGAASPEALRAALYIYCTCAPPRSAPRQHRTNASRSRAYPLRASGKNISARGANNYCTPRGVCYL